jgi:hypothetical protein
LQNALKRDIMYKIFSIKFSKKMERMLLFSFSSEKKEKAGLVEYQSEQAKECHTGQERSQGIV